MSHSCASYKTANCHGVVVLRGGKQFLFKNRLMRLDSSVVVLSLGEVLAG